MKRILFVMLTLSIFASAFAIDTQDIPEWKAGHGWIVKLKDDFYPEKYGTKAGYLNTPLPGIIGAAVRYSYDPFVLARKAKAAGFLDAVPPVLGSGAMKACSRYLLHQSVEEIEELNYIKAYDGGKIYMYTGDLSRFFFLEARSDAKTDFPNISETKVDPFKTTGQWVDKNFCEWGISLDGALGWDVCGTEYWRQYFDRKNLSAALYTELTDGTIFDFDHDCTSTLPRAHYIHMGKPAGQKQILWWGSNYRPAVGMEDVTVFLYSPMKLEYKVDLGILYTGTSLKSNSYLKFGMYMDKFTANTKTSQPADQTMWTHELDWESTISEWVKTLGEEEFELYRVENGMRVGEPIYKGTGLNFKLDLKKGDVARYEHYQVVSTIRVKDNESVKGYTVGASSKVISLIVPPLADNWAALDLTTTCYANDATLKNEIKNALTWEVSQSFLDKKSDKTYSQAKEEIGNTRTETITEVEKKYRIINTTTGAVVADGNFNNNTLTNGEENLTFDFGAEDPNIKYQVEVTVSVTTTENKQQYQKTGLFKKEWVTIESGTPTQSSISRSSNVVTQPYYTTTFSAEAIFHEETTVEDVNGDGESDDSASLETANVARYVDVVKFGKVTDVALDYYDVIDGEPFDNSEGTFYDAIHHISRNVEDPTWLREWLDEKKDRLESQYIGHLVTRDGSSWGLGKATTVHVWDELPNAANITITGDTIQANMDGNYDVNLGWETEYLLKNQNISADDYEISYKLAGEGNKEYTANPANVTVSDGKDEAEGKDVGHSSFTLDSELNEAIANAGVAEIEITVKATDNNGYKAEASKTSLVCAIAPFEVFGSNLIENKSLTYGSYVETKVPGANKAEDVTIKTTVYFMFADSSKNFSVEYTNAGLAETQIALNPEDIAGATVKTITEGSKNNVACLPAETATASLVKETYSIDSDELTISDKAVIGAHQVLATVNWYDVLVNAVIEKAKFNKAEDYMDCISKFLLSANEVIDENEYPLSIQLFNPAPASRKINAEGDDTDDKTIELDGGADKVRVKITGTTGSCLTEEGVTVKFNLIPVMAENTVNKPSAVQGGLGSGDIAATNDNHIADLNKNAKFNNSDVALGVDKLNSANASIKTGNHCIIVEGFNASIEVVNLLGLTIYQGNDSVISVNPGIYVVRVGGISAKVAVK